MAIGKVNNEFTRYFRIIVDKDNRRAYLGHRPTGEEGEQIINIKYKQGTYDYAVIDYLEAGIDQIKFVESKEYGDKVNIYMSDGVDKYCLQLKADNDRSEFLWHFLKKIKLINYNEPVRFRMYWPDRDPEVNKYDRPILLVQQHDEAEMKFKQLKGFSFEKEVVPDWNFLRDADGKLLAIDKSAALKFYKAVIEEVNKEIALYGDTAKKKQTTVDDEDDDLPF